MSSVARTNPLSLTAKPPTRMYSTPSAWKRRKTRSSASLSIPAGGDLQHRLQLPGHIHFIEPAVRRAHDTARSRESGAREESVDALPGPQSLDRIEDVGAAVLGANDACHVRMLAG